MFVVVVLVALHTTWCFAHQMQPATEQQLQKILVSFNNYAEDIMQARQTPGMAIAIIHDNKIIYAKGFGIRNIKGDPVTTKTVFNIGSLTKAFTATLLAMQIEEGKYNWHTKVIKLYSDFKLYDPEATQEFEIRDLIAHDSGLPEDIGNITDFGYNIDQAIHALRFIKPCTAFRTQFAYQNVFLLLAQRIIEEKSGFNYAENLHKKIFNPLNMKSSYAENKNFSVSTNISQRFFYARGKIKVYPENYIYFTDWGRAVGLASGGINSSAIDLANWLIFNINDGVFKGKQLISVENMRFMHSPQTFITKESSEGPAGDAYGEGWFYDSHNYKPYTAIYHPGNNPGASAFIKYIPETKIGIVILSNIWDPKLPKVLSDKFFDMYFNMHPKIMGKIEQISNKNTKQDKPLKCNIATNENLIKYTGVYFNDIFGDVAVTKEAGYLTLTIGPKNIKWRLYPYQNNIFKAYWLSGSKDIIMIPDDEAFVKFVVAEANNSISQMQVDFLNNYGNGIFTKYELNSIPTHHLNIR